MKICDPSSWASSRNEVKMTPTRVTLGSGTGLLTGLTSRSGNLLTLSAMPWRPVVSSEIVNGLRSSAQWIEEMEYESWLGTAELQRDAADVIERLLAERQAIDALLDAIDAQVAAYMNDSIGSSAAIQAISRLLTPWEARRER